MLRNKKKKGFTLIELLIVIAIIGILAAIAIPVYINFTTKARDAAANAAVGAFRTALELYRADSGANQYPALPATLTTSAFDPKYISMAQIGASVTIVYATGDATTYSFGATSFGTAGSKAVTQASAGSIW